VKSLTATENTEKKSFFLRECLKNHHKGHEGHKGLKKEEQIRVNP